MTFSCYNAHTNNLFFDLKILKLTDIMFLYAALHYYCKTYENPMKMLWFSIAISYAFHRVNL